MYTFGQMVYRNRLKVIILWVAILAGLGFFALKLPDVLSGNGFEYDGEYKKTQSILQEDFGYPDSSIILLFEKDRTVSTEKWQKFINSNLKSASKIKGIQKVISPFENNGMVKDDYAFAVLEGAKKAEDMGPTVSELRSAIHIDDGMKVSITGEPAVVKDLNEASQKDLAKAEMIGLPIALIVLLFAFGSLVAASLPLIIGVVSILSTMGLVYFYGQSFNLTIFILNIIPMIGLSLSIDFALLFISRYKEELRNAPTDTALATTVATAGKSIIFSALCVFIGLFALMFIEIDIFRNVALGGVTVVLISAFSALTLLPALLATIGGRIHTFTLLKVNSEKPGIWSHFANFVMRRPGTMSIIALAFLFIALVPLKNMILTVPGIDALPSQYESRNAYDKYERTFIDKDQRVENKVIAVIESDGPALEVSNLQNSLEMIHNINRDEKVASVESLFSVTGIHNAKKLVGVLQSPGNPLGAASKQFAADDRLLVNIYLNHDLSSSEKQKWVRKMAEKEHSATIYFGGAPKFEQEIFDEIWNKAPKGLFLIIISTFFILMLAFRSILIPLKAILMNVLSLGATFGIVVWIFQEGHLFQEPTTIALILPVFVFSLVFGLSMDYEVFLISRIHELYIKTGNNNKATLAGLISTSKIITSAAAIMIVITGAFAFTGVMPVKQMGIGIALAILLDATIIRMVLVPSLMKLLGDWNWWFFGRSHRVKRKDKGNC
ncbi:MMPL family transporter [Bacillus massilinigeriensis]|uniref:MMPL family transporter n=1 Tax=Bacillus mediterraneensis TaxID=1805474 RepID=UPI0008F953CD|nr:MMPL family transporter [Bacillus mediterraneensis]